MSYLKRSCSGGKSSKFLFRALSSLAAITAFLCVPCRGDDLTTPNLPQSVDSVVGPGQASLGSIADLQVPAGFKFMDAQAARSRWPQLLHKDALGVLTPEAGDWVVVFEYAEIGHVKEADKQLLDPAAILARVRTQVERQSDNSLRPGKTPVTGLAWALEPTYHADGHSLEWAIAADGGPGSVTNVNHTIRLLGRHGALDVVAVLTGSAELASVPLPELVKSITFKNGESYGDYRAGDPLCSLGLAQLIANDESSQAAGSGSEHSLAGSWVFWVGLVCGSGAVVVCVMFLRASRRHKKRAPAIAHDPAPAAVPVTATASPSANGSNHAVVSAPGSPPAGQPVKSQHRGHRGSRRRKSVDYTRYFMDLRSAVSDHSVYMDTDAGNEYPDEYSVQEAEAAPPTSPAPQAEKTTHTTASASANAEMIAHQKNLIEEQQRLIHEQTKLIEEKTKLVAEKNQLLARQAELIDERLLPS